MPARADTVFQPNDVRTRLLRAASYYMGLGLVLTPSRASTTKGAYLPGWLGLRLTLPQLAAELDRPGKGIGVVLGERSGGLVDVDLDHPAAVRAADALLPQTLLVSGRTARPRTHRFYRSPGAATVAYKADATGMLVELRAAGCQTVLPPSPHPEGRYHWDSLGDPADIDAARLRRLVGQTAAAAFLVAQGWRLDHALAFARRPSVERIREWKRQRSDCPPFNSWLSLPSSDGACRRQETAPKVGRSGASPYTTAVLDRAGGVVGAARLLGLELREGHQRCPWHEGKGARSLQVTGPLWRCHAGCGAGSSIHLAMKVLALGYQDARDALAVRLAIRWQDYTPRRGGGVNQPSRSRPAVPEHALDEFRGPRGAERDSRA